MEELLRRYIRGEVTSEERRKVARWLDEAPANMREFLALRKLYDISLWQTDMDVIPERRSVILPIRRWAFEMLKVAAILIVGFLLAKGMLTTQPEAVTMQTIHVPPGQRAELTLADGTEVWLNSGTTLRFPDRFDADSRQVELDGEGYFSVEYDESRPFAVQAGHYVVHVLGTEFNVKAYHDSPLFETALINGSVEISAPGMASDLRLKPDEVASVSDGKIRVTPILDYNYFKWTEGLLCFEDETIESLMAKLELYYDITIDIQRPGLLQHRYTGKFRIKDGIDHVLRVLQLKHHFSYTRDEVKNLITIK